jgi:hypothetical protein
MRTFIITFAFMFLACQAQAGTDGINQLITASELRASNANDEALEGANRQRGLVSQQKTLRNAQSAQNAAPAAPKQLKPPKATLQNPNIAKVKQMDAQMKALKQKLESVSGLPTDQQQKIDQMHDLLTKMMAVMNSLLDKMAEAQTAQ